MKFLLYTDVHFCENSSIVNSRGSKYSTRLENIIRSVDWAEEQAIVNNCDAVICLGDFFDRSDLRAEEISALQEIKWVNLPHYFLVGNHEAINRSLSYNSINALKKLKDFTIIDKPTHLSNDILMLPYINASDLKSLSEYWGDVVSDKKIIFSHNDVKGIQMGPIISKEGIDIDEIDSFCTMFINGHLHNGVKFSKKGINLGNLTGQNFGEDAFRYTHNAFILDTETLTLDCIENPHAFNFYKLELYAEKDLNKLYSLKNNAVVSIKCVEALTNEVKKFIETSNNVVTSRVLLIKTLAESGEQTIEDLIDNTTNHITKFINFVKENLENSEIVNYELEEICKNVVE